MEIYSYFRHLSEFVENGNDPDDKDNKLPLSQVEQANIELEDIRDEMVEKGLGDDPQFHDAVNDLKWILDWMRTFFKKTQPATDKRGAIILLLFARAVCKQKLKAIGVPSDTVD